MVNVCPLALCVALLPADPARGAVPRPDEAAIRERLEDIYARPRFRRHGDDSPGWLQRQLQAFLEWLGSLAEKSPVAWWLLLGLCVLLPVLAAVLVARKVRRAFYVAEGPGRRGPAAGQRARLSRAYRDEAGRRAERGEWTEAVRCLFLSLVYRFDETGRALFRQSDTNREYLGLFDDRPALAGSLREFVDTLDDYWYGQRPADERRYRHCLALYESLARQAA